MADMLVNDFEYFTKHHEELYGLYPNRYLVIKD